MVGLKQLIQTQLVILLMNLHSTMVGLKLSCKSCHSQHFAFTFHYGRIKTEKGRKSYEAKNPFTFHYGRIKTLVAFKNQTRYEVIYIPLWSD